VRRRFPHGRAGPEPVPVTRDCRRRCAPQGEEDDMLMTPFTKQRAETELARARAMLLSTHAHLIDGIAGRVGGLVPTARLVELYCRAQGLHEFDEQWLRIHAVAHSGTGTHPHAGGALRQRLASVVEEVRGSLAPRGNPGLAEALTYEFAAARGAVIRVHVRNAARLARALAADVSGPAAVQLYIRRMEVPDRLAGAVHAFAVAHLGEHRAVQMLSSGMDGSPLAAEAIGGEVPADPRLLAVAVEDCDV
jgi:hypothetical protein